MNVLCFSFKSKNNGLSSKSKKDYSMGKGKGTTGQTMIYKNKLQHMLRMIALGLVGILFMLSWLVLLVLGVTSRAGTVYPFRCT
jgi:hypothetical protein